MGTVNLPLVGREAELAVLTAALAPGTGPRAVVLVGEAGVGKTRLVDEAVRRGAEAGIRTLSGSCLPLAASVPFLPLSEALRDVDPAVLDRCSPYVRSEVARLVPGWGTAAPSPIDGWEQGRLFAALHDLLTAIAPQALVVEDIHWADPSSLDFMAYHRAGDREGSTPMVLTCRDEEIDTIREWLAEFERHRDVVRLKLARLSRDEVARHMNGLLGGVPAGSYVDEVYARAGGNAFFTEQLVAAGSGALPEGLAQLLVARAETVGADARRTLRTLAIAGRPVDEQVLAGPNLSGSIRQLIAARLVEPPDQDGRYRLRHALVGEAITAAMTPGERRDRHARIAVRFGRAGAAPAEIAEHWAAAGIIRQEVPSRLAAAQAAEKTFAFREAATHWLRLIELSAQVPVGDLADLYLRALDALDRCSDGAASGLADEAFRTLAAGLDRPRLALLHERRARYHWMSEAPAAIPELETAIELLEGLPPGPELAVVLHSYGAVLADLGRLDESRAVLVRALESSPRTKERVKIMRDLGRQAVVEGDRKAGWVLLDKAAAEAASHGDPLLIAGVENVRAAGLMIQGDLVAAAELAGSALAKARRAGLDRHYATEFLVSSYFEALAGLGRPEEAAAAIPANEEATSVGSVALARAYLELLAGNDINARLAELEAAMSPVNFDDAGYVCDLSEIELWLGRPAKALGRILRLPGGFELKLHQGYTCRLLRIAVQACADLADAARAEGDATATMAARRAADDLIRTHAATRPDPFDRHPTWATPPADGASWRAELTRVAGQPDPVAWVDASTAWQRLGFVHRAAYARWRQGEALLTLGSRAQAARILREAAQAAPSHAPLLAAIRETARLARLPLSDEPMPVERSLPYGLTAREKAVLALVAEGLTNVQIGRRLFISESTVSVHVTNLMRKLDVSNRAQAAARGQRAGLIG